MPGEVSFDPDFAVALKLAEGGTGAVIEVRGELDSGTCDELFEAFQGAVANGPKELTLDLRQLTFIDSAGTGALIMIERSAAEQNISLVVTPPPAQVTELLQTAGVADRLRLGSQAHSAPAVERRLIERTELELSREPHSPARARAEVRESLPTADQSRLSSLVLLTSELVTNAVLHPRGVDQTPIGLRLMVYDDLVRVEVEDAGEGFEQVLPVVPEAERGRGLFLVDQVANRWGSGRVQTDAGPRFRVWFEIDWSNQGNAAVA